MYTVHTTYGLCTTYYYVRKRIESVLPASFVALMALENNARYTAKMVIMMQINPSRQEG